jgi:hypothetical protein
VARQADKRSFHAFSHGLLVFGAGSGVLFEQAQCVDHRAGAMGGAQSAQVSGKGIVINAAAAGEVFGDISGADGHGAIPAAGIE